MASAAWWIHSPAKGATAKAPTSTRRRRSARSPRCPPGLGLVGPGTGDLLGEVDLGLGDVQAGVSGGVRVGQADGGDLGVGEDDAGDC
jgi:hypothetical protein